MEAKLFTDLLHNAQLHNADQLSTFLLHFIAINVITFEENDELQKLSGENLSYVQAHQWQPAASYINAVKRWKEKHTVKYSSSKNCVVM